MINLVDATIIVDGALAHRRSLGLQPLTVAVLDAGGYLVSFKREDGSSLLRPAIAQAKAWGALGMGMGTRTLAQRAAEVPAFISALNALTGGQLISTPGSAALGTFCRRSPDHSKSSPSATLGARVGWLSQSGSRDAGNTI